MTLQIKASISDKEMPEVEEACWGIGAEAGGVGKISPRAGKRPGGARAGNPGGEGAEDEGGVVIGSAFVVVFVREDVLFSLGAGLLIGLRACFAEVEASIEVAISIRM